MRIGVVIPTIDEERALGQTLRALSGRGRPAVVVVADCGSRDATEDVARRHGAIVVADTSFNCRSAAMNAGAAVARREVNDLDALWFLHADSTPPVGWDRAIAAALDDPRAVGGAFNFQWDYEGVPWFTRTKLNLLSRINRIRFRITGIYFGDQGIFVRTGAFAQVGGMPDVALMEDVIFCRRLKRIGHLRVAREKVRTSPRRFLRHGVCRQMLIDTWLLAAERLGLSPARLHAWYNEDRS